MPRDITKAASDSAKVLFENDHIRVVELNWKKGANFDMHSHPKYFAYAMGTMKYRSKGPDGKTKVRTMKKGEVQWYDAESHAVENLGETGRALIVELK